MQFQIPQFIETEDKIIGALTFKQFVYVGTTFMVLILLFMVLDFWLWIIIAAILGSASLGVAFVKVNGRPMVIFLSALIRGVWQPRVYVFGASMEVAVEETKEIAAPAQGSQRKAARGYIGAASGGLKKLREQLLTSKSAIPQRERPLPQSFGAPQKDIREKYEVIEKLTGEKEVARRVDYR